MPPRKPPPGAEIPVDEAIREVETRVRTAKYVKMETAVQGFYVMVGGALTVLPNEVAGEFPKRVGRSFVRHSDDIAEAWIDLAEDDARVRRIIESVTGFSTWGKVIGRHLEAIGDETPGIAAIRRTPQQQQSPQGAPMDLEAMMGLAQMFAQGAAQERMQEPPNGEAQPDEAMVRRMMDSFLRQQQRPVRQQQQQPVAAPVHPMGASGGLQGQPMPAGPAPQTGRPRAGMPSPAEMGVSIADADEIFPASGSENVQ